MYDCEIMLLGLPLAQGAYINALGQHTRMVLAVSLSISMGFFWKVGRFKRSKKTQLFLLH
jgi:hypothetical protein